MILVGLTGGIGAGKSTVADLLVEQATGGILQGRAAIEERGHGIRVRLGDAAVRLQVCQVIQLIRIFFQIKKLEFS